MFPFSIQILIFDSNKQQYMRFVIIILLKFLKEIEIEEMKKEKKYQVYHFIQISSLIYKYSIQGTMSNYRS